MSKEQTRRIFCLYFHFINWHSISLGLHIDLRDGRLELHIPFGFVAVGFHRISRHLPINYHQIEWRSFGWNQYRHAAPSPLLDAPWGSDH